MSCPMNSYSNRFVAEHPPSPCRFGRGWAAWDTGQIGLEFEHQEIKPAQRLEHGEHPPPLFKTPRGDSRELLCFYAAGEFFHRLRDFVAGMSVCQCLCGVGAER